MKNKLLILNHIFWPDKINTSRHISELAEELCNRGLDVSVIVGNRDYRTNEKFRSEESWNGVRIYRVNVPVLFGNSWIQRMFTSGWLLISFSIP